MFMSYVWITMYISYSIALPTIISSCFSDNLIHDMIVLSSIIPYNINDLILGILQLETEGT